MEGQELEDEVCFELDAKLAAAGVRLTGAGHDSGTHKTSEAVDGTFYDESLREWISLFEELYEGVNGDPEVIAQVLAEAKKLVAEAIAAFEAEERAAKEAAADGEGSGLLPDLAADALQQKRPRASSRSRQVAKSTRKKSRSIVHAMPPSYPYVPLGLEGLNLASLSVMSQVEHCTTVPSKTSGRPRPLARYGDVTEDGERVSRSRQLLRESKAIEDLIRSGHDVPRRPRKIRKKRMQDTVDLEPADFS